LSFVKVIYGFPYFSILFGDGLMIFDDKRTYFFLLFPIVFLSDESYGGSRKRDSPNKAIFTRTGVSMKKLVCLLALGLSASLLMSPLSVHAQTGSIEFKVVPPATNKKPSKKEEPDPCAEYKKGEQASQSLKLYYIRRATNLKTILDKIAEANSCIEGTIIEAEGDNTIVLYGKDKQREELKRVITVLDLPRERVNMEMWGILISSDNPQQLAEVMGRVNKEIDKTQKLLRETYKELEDGARDITIDTNYKKVFEEDLGYKSALDPDRSSLSMIDILLRINAADNPVSNNNASANKICELFKKSQYEDYVEALTKEDENKRPFGNYLRVGLLQKEKAKGIINQDCMGVSEEETEKIKLRRQKAVLDFSLQYAELRDNPAGFNALALQQSAESLNALLNPLVDAINRDVEDLFIKPTLTKIQNIVGEYDDVSYAEVGKTSVAGLNGVPSTVASTTVSAFDETGPLRLNQLISEAGNLNTASKDLLPDVKFGESTIPVSSLVSVVAALSKDRSLWRGLTSGVSLSVTPSVLRNSESAELQIDLTTAPTDTQTKTGDGELRPLSRISQNKVTTSVYVNTLDLFALSTFNSQTTIDGGRWYIPVIGTVWKGFFSGIPVFGDLFSIKNDPKNVQHQSIVLTNSFIVPTAMGIAHLYDNNNQDQQKIPFYYRCSKVEEYINDQKNKLGQSQASSDLFTINDKIRSVCGNPPSPPLRQL